jgi:hypothetical protein
MKWGQLHWATNYFINDKLPDNPYREPRRITYEQAKRLGEGPPE